MSRTRDGGGIDCGETSALRHALGAADETSSDGNEDVQRCSYSLNLDFYFWAERAVAPPGWLSGKSVGRR